MRRGAGITGESPSVFAEGSIEARLLWAGALSAPWSPSVFAEGSIEAKMLSWLH